LSGRKSDWESNQVKITEKDVRYVAALANLEVTDEEASDYAANMTSILDYVDKLNELDTSEVEPMAQVLTDAPEGSSLRPDVHMESLPLELSMANAPESGAGHFKVPKVIER
jgi:aspartyl-tRNA(Asn)/glutamyl-tRNA(Gln) amidotransferase subunit C